MKNNQLTDRDHKNKEILQMAMFGLAPARVCRACGYAMNKCTCRQPSTTEKPEVKAEVKKHKDIARIDQEDKKTYGWYVRVRFQGETHCKFFSDLKSGGRQVALLAAISWRNAKERELGKPRTDRHLVSVGNRGTTGVIGVIFEHNHNRYAVTWVTPDGKQGKTSVSVKKHGREKAFELAKQIRAEKENIRLSAARAPRKEKKLQEKQ